MAPTKAQDTSHLDNFSADELEDILVQLCDSEGVKVSPGDDKVLKNMGKNALDSVGLGGLGKKVFGGGKKNDAPPASPDEPAPPSTPAGPAAPAPTPPAPQNASDIIRQLSAGDKQGLIGVLQSVLSTVMSGGADGKGGGNLRRSGGLSLKSLASSALFACFGNLLKGGGGGGGDKARTAQSTNAAQADGQQGAGQAAASAGNLSLEDVKTPDALLKFITTNPTVKTMVISGVQSFLAKVMQGQGAAGKA